MSIMKKKKPAGTPSKGVTFADSLGDGGLGQISFEDMAKSTGSVATPAKRGRGQPKKKAGTKPNGAKSQAKPKAAAGAPTGSSKKRGRPPKKTNKSPAKRQRVEERAPVEDDETETEGSEDEVQAQATSTKTKVIEVMGRSPERGGSTGGRAGSREKAQVVRASPAKQGSERAPRSKPSSAEKASSRSAEQAPRLRSGAGKGTASPKAPKEQAEAKDAQPQPLKKPKEKRQKKGDTFDFEELREEHATTKKRGGKGEGGRKPQPQAANAKHGAGEEDARSAPSVEKNLAAEKKGRQKQKKQKQKKQKHIIPKEKEATGAEIEMEPATYPDVAFVASAKAKTLSSLVTEIINGEYRSAAGSFREDRTLKSTSRAIKSIGDAVKKRKQEYKETADGALELVHLDLEDMRNNLDAAKMLVEEYKNEERKWDEQEQVLQSNKHIPLAPMAEATGTASSVMSGVERPLNQLSGPE
ncbi:unnamed protein product [Chrysoparadoxa australica]